MKRTISTMLVFAVCSISTPLAWAGVISTDWSDYEAQTAAGVFGEVQVAATSLGSSPFATTLAGRFSGSSWQATMELPETVTALGALNANQGDSHTFAFSDAISDAFLYIENFDASSAAQIQIVGSGNLELVSGSESISFQPDSASSGMLKSSNVESDGEGDAVLRLQGSVTSVVVDYVGGEGANGVFYTFAVPEPSALALLLPLLGLAACRRRR